ncbi:MAG: hypothetical protein QW327_04640 [Candidatus Odinarchaeota archaeon]
MRYILIGVDFRELTDDKQDIDNGLITSHLNLLCNCTRSALLISDGIRLNVKTVFFNPWFNSVVTVDGSKVKYMGPDLRSISLLLVKAFNLLRAGVKKQTVNSTPGITVIRECVSDYLRPLVNSEDIIYYYREDSPNIEPYISAKDQFLLVFLKPSIIDDSLKLLEEFNLKTFKFKSGVNINPYELITIYQNYLDMMLNGL